CFILYGILMVSLLSLSIGENQLGNCQFKISPTVTERLLGFAKSGKNIFIFEFHLSDKKLDNLLNAMPWDYFAMARTFTWISQNSAGMIAYKQFYYDFSIRSFNLLKEYIANIKIGINVNCTSENIQRHDIVFFIFQELMGIIFANDLLMKDSGYMCFFINLSLELQETHPRILKSYRNFGINREIVKKYCCQIKRNSTIVNDSKLICKGQTMKNSQFVDFENIIGAILWAFLPLFITFVRKAQLPSFSHHFPAELIPNDKLRITNTLPDELEWISEKHGFHASSQLLSWICCFRYSTYFASRLRRLCFLVVSLSILFFDILMHYFFLYETVEILYQDEIPLGHRALIFGIEESYKNTDGFFGGPFVWLISYFSLNLILFVVPSRLSETITYNIPDQISFTFLIQSIELLKHYGNLDISCVEHYDRLYEILKANISTALNPDFWKLVFNTWKTRINNIWFSYYRRHFLWQFIMVWPLIFFTILLAVLFVCEFLLCLIYYGIPIIYLILTIPQNYSKFYIFPIFRNPSYILKMIAVILMALSLPFFILWGLYSIYIFLVSFQVLCNYVFTLAIVFLIKPDVVGNFWFIVMFFIYGIEIIKSIEKQYGTILVQSTYLAKNIRPDLVQTKYGEDYIYAGLFKTILHITVPLRYEVGKGILKLFLITSFFLACNEIINKHDLELTEYTKIILILMTSMIPKMMSIINTNIDQSSFQQVKIIDIINNFQTHATPYLSIN
ncbi:uncharacterized protein LOC115209402 isoform X1, partial [Argonauta hians]